MDRSRSKRYYYDQDYDPEPLPRTKQRYNNNNSNNHYRRKDPNLMVTTTYRILCLDIKAGGVIGKSGSIIKSIRQHTGAWINMHELLPGDEERIIEISDTRRRDPDGRMPSFSPAQEALFLIHERILETDGGPAAAGYNFGDEEDDYGMRGGGGGNRVVTRLVVSRMHVGCLLGKGGKIIEQMRTETRTHIRILPRDHNIPRCVAMSEEIVQVHGDMNAVKNAIEIISSRLRESQHRDRGNFHGRLPSPDRFFPPDDDYISPMNRDRSSMDSPSFEPRFSASFNGPRSSRYSSHQSAYAADSGHMSMDDNEQSFSREDLIFQILCPIEKIDNIIGESDGIVDLLQNEIGVDIRIVDPVFGSDEQIIIISSEEGPDDELFPAQEALLHIQTRIVDIVPEKQNIITTRLLVPSGEIGCLEGRNGLSEMRKITGADVQILPREELPVCVSENDELLQIVGEIKAAREALVEVTSRLRSYLYQDFYTKDAATPPRIAHNSVGSALGPEATSNNNINRETGSANHLPTASSQNVQIVAPAQLTKESGGSNKEAIKLTENERREGVPSVVNRYHGPLVTRSTLEVVIPQHAVPKLITKSKNKLAQISELSGAAVRLIEDGAEASDNVIQISGTPEQAEKAQSLLQGFILSTLEE